MQFDVLQIAQQYGGIFLLMLSTFLIGYFFAFNLVKNKYKKTIKKLKKEVNASISQNSVNNIDTIFTEIKPKIEAIVRESQSTNFNKVTPKEVIAQRAKNTFNSYNNTKPTLNFEVVGPGSPSNSDDLTLIEGIGPYVEERLNNAGIYNYRQISKLEISEIRKLTDIIDFFPGRIERDQWVEQAKSLLNKRYV